MSKTTACKQCAGYLAIAGDDYNTYDFESAPDLLREPVELTGGVINPGDLIRGMFGPQTCAGTSNFHPIAPGHLVYEGLYVGSDHTLMLCSFGECDRENYFYGWVCLGKSGDLLHTLRNGASVCVVQTAFLFLNGDFPPLECLESKHFWKRLSKQKEAVAI